MTGSGSGQCDRRKRKEAALVIIYLFTFPLVQCLESLTSLILCISTSKEYTLIHFNQQDSPNSPWEVTLIQSVRVKCKRPKIVDINIAHKT